MANLLTIDDYKTYKNVNSQNDDSIISLLIGSVSDFVKEYTGRALIDYYHNDKVEYFDATSYAEYYPDEFPLRSVTELAVSSDGGVTYTVLVENTDYFVDLQDNIIINNTVYTGFSNSTIPHKSGRLTYKAGYDKVPQDLKLACLDLVHYYRKEEYSVSKAMQSASVDNPVFVQNNAQLPPHIKRVFDHYRLI